MLMIFINISLLFYFCCLVWIRARENERDYEKKVVFLRLIMKSVFIPDGDQIRTSWEMSYIELVAYWVVKNCLQHVEVKQSLGRLKIS